MKFLFAVLFFFFIASSIQARNLLYNTDFKIDYADVITDWRVSGISEDGMPGILVGDGVDGRNAIRLNGLIGQRDFILVPGARYRVGIWVRTKGFKPSARAYMFVVNPGWTIERGIESFPENTNGEWKKVEHVIEAQDCKYHSVFICSGEGVLDISSPFVEPVDQKADDGAVARVPSKGEIEVRILPCRPLLSRLSAKECSIEFFVPFPLEKAEKEYVLRTTLNGKAVRENALTSARKVVVSFGNQEPGPAAISVALIDKATGKTIATNEYSGKICPQLPEAKSRVLNNLVSVLVEQKAENGTVRFVNPREGWVYIGFIGAGTKVNADVDGTPVVIPRQDELPETMRYLDAGEHTLTVRDCNGGILSIRTIPEIMAYPINLAEKETVGLNFYHTVDFFKKYMLHSFNTFNCWGWSGKKFNVAQEFKERGIQVLLSSSCPQTQPKLEEALTTILGRCTEYEQGLTIDEIHTSASAPWLNALIQSLWKRQDEKKVIYTWISSGEFDFSPVHANFLSACANVSCGRGKLLLEDYIRSSNDEKGVDEAVASLTKQAVSAELCIPGSTNYLFPMMSGYCSMGWYNVDCYPETDIRYVFDRFLQKVATAPEFRNVYGTGCYELGQSDEELTRWVAALARHYCIDGKTELMGNNYGIVCNPGHLKDGDFTNGFEAWNASPAATDSLKPLKVQGYGYKFQKRQTRNGDTTALFVRSANKPNVLSQTAHRLVPGKLYFLKFVTADYDDILEPRNAHQPFQLSVTLNGGTVIPEKGYLHKKPEGWDGSRYQKKDLRAIHTRKIVFKAEAENCDVIFSDWKSANEAGGDAGQRTLLNFVSLMPYFEN